ncbi:MAG: nodulation protein NfeD [Deltaproteobacteria bacterium]|nr:nodulation protein NfeD [Deltaproteobacteria bacterium]MBW2120361.1 nodulation protein NfeD [Deltaproteobacteria bacterium]
MKIWSFVVVLLVFLSLGSVSFESEEQIHQESHIDVIEVDGIINPVSAKYIVRSIDRASEEGAQCLIITLDTPGGLMESMREIVKKMLSAEVPVVVYVAPSGARAASAGVFVTMAAHVAAMAPSTNIGAAHPVTLGGKEQDKTMMEKIVNDTVAYARSIARKRGRNQDWAAKAVEKSVSITDDEAVKLKVVDLVSPSLEDLIQELNGRKIDLDGKAVILHTKGALVHRIPMNWKDRLLDAISHPQIAYLLFLLGMMGIYFEISNPGAILPGVIGGIAIILAFFAMQVLPINYAGLALIILGGILFIAEIKVTSYGLLSVAGVFCLLMGSLMLIDNPTDYLRLSWQVILPAVAVSASFFIFAVTMAIRARLKKPTTGVEGLVGRIGVAEVDFRPDGRVAVYGEIWTAESEDKIKKGDKVEVIGVDKLRLTVKKV